MLFRQFVECYDNLRIIKYLTSYIRALKCLNGLNVNLGDTKVIDLTLAGLKNYQKKNSGEIWLLFSVDMTITIAHVTQNRVYDNNKVS